jgi:hypothetical protein
MRGVIRRLDQLVEARPWLTASCLGVLVAVTLLTLEWALDDSPDWLFPILLTLTLTLMVGFKGQSQRRRRDHG